MMVGAIELEILSHVLGQRFKSGMCIINQVLNKVIVTREDRKTAKRLFLWKLRVW